MFALYCIVFIFVYLGVNIVLIWLRNYKAHQFFKFKAPKLPVLPNTKIFSGHIFEVTQQRKNWKVITDLHERYGPTFGFYMCNQAWVSTKDLDLIKLIEVDQARKHINRTKFGLPFEEFNNSIFQLDDDDWRKVRRAIAPALTNHKVRSDEVSDDINSILDQLVEALEFKISEAAKESSKREIVIDVHDTFQRYSLAVIFLITYKRSNIVDFYAKSDRWVGMIEKGMRDISNPLVPIAVMFPFLRPACRFLAQFSEIGSFQAKVIDYISQATDLNRIARENHDVIQRKMSIQTGGKERRFSDLIRQGFETTADTITCLVWQLARNPEIQERLREDIAVQGIDCEFLMWCIQETVRWHPAVPLGTGRVLGEDVTVNGLHLPKGTFIMPSTYSIHHDPAIWPEPDQFKPDRWHYQSIFHPAAFMGFGLGPRNCVGGKLAIHEIKLVMQMLLSRYRIEECSETCREYNFASPGLLYTLLDQPIKVKLVALT